MLQWFFNQKLFVLGKTLIPKLPLVAGLMSSKILSQPSVYIDSKQEALCVSAIFPVFYAQLVPDQLKNKD